MNKQEMNDHCELLARQLVSLHSGRGFMVDWDADPHGVEVTVWVLDEHQRVENEFTVVRGAKTKQAAADIASGWVEGLAVGLDGGAC